MVFNWFRRRFDEPKVPQQEVTEPETVETPQIEPPEPTETTEDYLSWAKAAYQNIQQRQAQPAEATATSPVTEADATEAVPAEPPVTEALDSAEPVEPAAAAAESPASLEAPPAPVEMTTTATEVAGESLPTAVPVEAPMAAADSFSEPAGETVQTASAPLSFLARAEAEREARLARLQETAVEEPESQPAPATAEASATAETSQEVPGLAFDEGFLWSAELLAAQGRRADEISLEEITWLKRLRQGLDKTRRSLVNQLKAIVGQGPLNQDAVMEIEMLLLQADVGVEATDTIIEALQNKLRQEVLPPDAAIAYLKQILRKMLDNPLGQSYSPTFAPEKGTLNIWLLTGVNGAGKTTTLGKIAHIAQESNYRCLIAAADTFRAAAVEQVKIWGQRSGVEVIANPGQNTDPAAVVYDAIAAAQARSIDLLLVDTAGRLQNKKNLMDELSKIRRIVDKKAANAKIESLLVLDATLGQNGLRQAQVFSEAAGLTGVVLTKLDGTAKGGIALAVVQQLGLPIRFIGAGEGIKDLRPFSSYEFVEALLSG